MPLLLRKCSKPVKVLFALSNSRIPERAFSSSVQRLNLNKVYELRTYTVKPDKFIDFLFLTHNHINKRTQHSKLYGYWTVDHGGALAQVLHIWGYDSYSHRNAVRKLLSQDTSWQNEYTKEMMPMLDRQETLTMRAVSWYQPQRLATTGGVYELTTDTFIPGKWNQLSSCWQMAMDAWRKHDPPVGIWLSELGPMNRVYTLKCYPDVDERCQLKETIMKEPEIRDSVRECAEFIVDSNVKILTPTNFSGWK